MNPENKLQFSMARDLTRRSYQELKNPPQGVRIYRLPTFTNYLGGLRPHELTLLCAGTGTGKTALIATLAADIALQGVPIFVAPVETGDVDFMTRVISSAVSKELNIGEAVSEPTLSEAFQSPQARAIHDSPLYISNYDNRVEIEEMVTVLEFMATQGVRVALLDNLNFFLKISSTDMERAVMDEAIHSLVMFCKKNPMHIILITHPRKTVNGRVESEYDIKGSATSVQECANVALFNRPTEEQIGHGRNWFQREFVFRKIRKRGMYVNKPIWLEYRHGGYYECK